MEYSWAPTLPTNCGRSTVQVSFSSFTRYHCPKFLSFVLPHQFLPREMHTIQEKAGITCRGMSLLPELDVETRCADHITSKFFVVLKASSYNIVSPHGIAPRTTGLLLMHVHQAVIADNFESSSACASFSSSDGILLGGWTLQSFISIFLMILADF